MRRNVCCYLCRTATVTKHPRTIRIFQQLLLTPWATPHTTRDGKGMSNRAKQSNVTCFVAFLRHFTAITPLKCQFSSSCALNNMSMFFGQDLATAVYVISNNAWYHCGKPITNLKLSNLYLILPRFCPNIHRSKVW